MGTTSDRDVIATDADLGRIGRAFPSFSFDSLLEVTGKCKIHGGNVDGKPVVAKMLVNAERQWVDRFRHEIEFYRRVEHASISVSIPKVYAADEKELLIVAVYRYR